MRQGDEVKLGILGVARLDHSQGTHPGVRSQLDEAGCGWQGLLEQLQCLRLTLDKHGKMTTTIDMTD